MTTNHATTTADLSHVRHDVAGYVYDFALSRVEMFARCANPVRGADIMRAFDLGSTVGDERKAEGCPLPARTMTHPIARAFAWGRWAVVHEHDDGPVIVPVGVLLDDMAALEQR